MFLSSTEDTGASVEMTVGVFYRAKLKIKMQNNNSKLKSDILHFAM